MSTPEMAIGAQIPCAPFTEEFLSRQYQGLSHRASPVLAAFNPGRGHIQYPWDSLGC